MLSDFYLPPPLPPLPFHKEEDDLATSSYDHQPYPSSLFPCLFGDERRRSHRLVASNHGTSSIQRTMLPSDEEGTTMSSPRSLLSEETAAAAPEILPFVRQPPRMLEPAINWSPSCCEWGCPGCMIASPFKNMDEDVGLLAGGLAEGDTTDGEMLFVVNGTLRRCISGDTSSPLTTLASPPETCPNFWQEGGPSGPVPSVDSIQLGFGEAFDGSVYSWPSGLLEPSCHPNPSPGYSYPPPDGSLPHHNVLLPSYGGNSPSSTSTTVPVASHLTASSEPSPYPPSAAPAAASTWFSSPPSVIVAPTVGITYAPSPVMAMVPLTTANGAVAVLPADRKAADTAAPKRKRVPNPCPHNVCAECGTNKTPEWRRGPAGPRTLCNACGLRYAKRNKKKKKEEENAANGGQQACGTTAQLPLKPGSKSPRSGRPLARQPESGAFGSDLPASQQSGNSQ